MIDFFNIEDNDASKVIWSHAVNSKYKLSKALVDESMVLEADIIFIEDKHNEPIMAHPPDTQSDISFSEWLKESLKDSNKAIKLDFKTASSVEPCLKILNSMQDEVIFKINLI